MNKERTPLPLSLMLYSTLCYFFGCMTYTMVYSYLPRLLRSFHTPEVDVGFYAGTISSSLFIAQTLVCVIWGALADWMGRKNMSTLCTAYLALTTLLFGFSTSYSWALTTRILQGTGLGLFSLAKSWVVLNCDDTNMSLAVSIIGAAYSAGTMAGPVIGGLLAFPNQQFPKIFIGATLLQSFPILLPNLVITVGLIANVVFGRTLQDITENKRYHRQELKNDSGKHAEFENKPPRYIDVFRNKWLILSCWSYCLFSILYLGVGELFSLFAATSIKYKGLAEQPNQVGLQIFLAMIPRFIAEMFLLPKVSNILGAKLMSIYSNLVLVISIPMLPLIGKINNTIFLWVMVVLYLIIYRLLCGSVMLAGNLLFINSVPESQLGIANGMAIGFSGFGGFIGTLVAGSLYSWSLTNIEGIPDNKNPLGFPFNEYFPFIVFSMVTLANAILVSLLPDRLNKKCRWTNKYDKLIKSEEN